MYRYQLRSRPASAFTTPDFPGRRFTDENDGPNAMFKHGSVYYAEPLPLAEVVKWELLPVTETNALNGVIIKEQFGRLLLYRKLTVSDLIIHVETRMIGKEKTTTSTTKYIDIAKMIESGQAVICQPGELTPFSEGIKTAVFTDHEGKTVHQCLAII